jgi:hypothetical protein
MTQRRIKTKEENDKFFNIIAQYSGTFEWQGHQLFLMEGHMKVENEDVLKRLKNETSEETHQLFKLKNNQQ